MTVTVLFSLQCHIYDHHDVMTADMSNTGHLFLYNVKSTVTIVLLQPVWLLLSICSFTMSNLRSSWCHDSWYDCYCPFVPLQCQIYSHHDVMTAGMTVTVHLFLYNVKSTVITMSWQMVYLLLSICSFIMSNLRSSWCHDSCYICYCLFVHL